MNNLSRNTPIAFVVGAAGFLGSHLVENLLKKGIQVIGVDDLSAGSKENLEQATHDKRFEFIYQPMEELMLVGASRMDYAFFLINENIPAPAYQAAFNNFLRICEKFKPKIVLVSSIELYDSENQTENLLQAEKQIAKFAIDKGVNTRIIRLAPVYGPRMHFRNPDPIVKLVESAASGELQKQSTALDFSTRSLFVSDAVELLLKAVMHGSTAQKIYDGSLLSPIKVTEIKQILLDPVWHETKAFQPTELPPWTTPNLIKTTKELAWHPDTNIVKGLKQTLEYFRGHRNLLKRENTGEEVAKQEVKQEVGKWFVEEKNENSKAEKEEPKIYENKKEKKGSKDFQKKARLFTRVGLVLLTIVLGLFYPVLFVVFHIWSIDQNLQEASFDISAGEFDKAREKVDKAVGLSKELEDQVASFQALEQIGFARGIFSLEKEVSELVTGTTKVANQSALGASLLVQSLKIISGEQGHLKDSTSKALLSLSQAEKELSLVDQRLERSKNLNNLPQFLQQRVNGFRDKLINYQELIVAGQNFALILNEAIPVEGKKSYLVVLQDNRELRGGGGVIKGYALVNFDKGKFINIEAEDVSKLDSLVGEKLNPSPELKADLGVNNWQFKDFNFEIDVPTNAKLIQWYFNKASDQKVSGVILLDTTAVTSLLESSGPLVLPEGQKEVTSQNYIELVLDDSNRKIKPLFLKEFIQKLFFVPNQNWPKIAQVLSQQFEQKHVMVYISEPKLYSYLTAQNLTGNIVSKKVELGGREEFLSLVDSNMGYSPISFGIKKEVNYQITIDDQGQINHKVVARYENQDLNNVYKNRLRAYLASGSVLKRVSFGGKEITKEVRSFSDYGKAGYSMMLILKPGEKKELMLEFQDQKTIDFDQNKFKLSVNLLKQPGSLAYPVSLKVNHPDTLKAEAGNFTQSIPQEIEFNSSLEQDQIFEVSFSK